MKRGDVVIISAPGDYGKPRPAVIVQTDFLNATHPSLIVCPITSHRVDAPLLRIDIHPSSRNGIREPSQIMADKLITMRREKIGGKIGQLSKQTMARLNGILLFVLGVAENAEE